MGGVLGCLACNAGACVASGICSCFSSAVSKASAGRIVYCAVFLLTSVLAWIFRGYGAEIFARLPIEGTTVQQFCAADNEDCFGVLTVMRISFALAAFHLLHSVLMIGTTSKKDFRVSLQDGWWPIKLAALLGLEAAGFFIPNGFFRAYGWVALVCSGLFILVQLVMLVDFAHGIAEQWISKHEDAEEGDNRWWYLLLGCTLALYATSIVGTGFMYHYFVSSSTSCAGNIVLITFNLILCFGVSFVSIHPKVQEQNQTSGLLQSSMVASYCTYLTWSALMSQPDATCNPFTNTDTTTNNISVVIGAIFCAIAVCYSTMRAASQMSNSTTQPEGATLLRKDTDEEAATAEAEAEDDPDTPVSYNLSRFHIVFMLGAMYVGMLMSDWQTIDSAATQIGAEVNTGRGAEWVKLSSAWVCFLVYAWTLVAPVLLPDREWK